MKFYKDYMKTIYVTFVFSILLASCNDANKDGKATVEEWVGKVVVIPEQLIFRILNDEIDVDLMTPDYKIINFIDSSGCTSCRMKLSSWNETIDDFKSIPDVDIEFLTIVNTDDVKELEQLLKHDNYLHPVAIDRYNTFGVSNRLPKKSEYHTFLLDADNKVLAIGNPVLNPKIKKLYKMIIQTHERDIARLGRKESRALGLVRCNNTVSTIFTIPNYDSIAHHIQDIIPSCHCITAISSTRTIQPGTDVVIDVTYINDSMPGRFTRYVDVFYEEKDYPDRLIVYGYCK